MRATEEEPGEVNLSPLDVLLQEAGERGFFLGVSDESDGGVGRALEIVDEVFFPQLGGKVEAVAGAQPDVEPAGLALLAVEVSEEMTVVSFVKEGPVDAVASVGSADGTKKRAFGIGIGGDLE